MLFTVFTVSYSDYCNHSDGIYFTAVLCGRKWLCNRFHGHLHKLLKMYILLLYME